MALNYCFRHLARVVVEAETPLAVGSGEKSITSDSLVLKDVNGLPFIPGTSLAGVFRETLDELNQKLIFGYQEKRQGHGSNIIFSDAKLLDSEGNAVDGILPKMDSFLAHYENLPVRQHARIGHDGTVEKGGKFDEEIVYKGSRFCFEVELLSEENDDNLIEILSKLKSSGFRIGGGSRKGFGKLKVVSTAHARLNLSDARDLGLYLSKSSNLAESWDGWQALELTGKQGGWNEYVLHLSPEDFFMFGSGFGDESGDADMTQVKEPVVEWRDGHGTFVNKMLIPAASVKGAISHRLAYHYNKLMGNFAEDMTASELKQHIGGRNDAVRAYFGAEAEGDEETSRGKVIFSDIFEECPPEKLLNHVVIDSFTGGAMDGGLFTEKPVYGRDKKFVFRILVSIDTLDISAEMEKAFVSALKDLCSGMLPLGGGVNRGNGVFTGKLFKNGEVIYEA